jgi:hypothetical protein
MKILTLFLILFPHLILSIVFVQSGLDKICDWNGNLSWVQSYFSKSPLRSISKGLLVLLTFLETLGGTLGLIGASIALLTGLNGIASDALLVSMVLSGLALLGLMLGQRLAKDYAGAANLVGYCLLLALSFLLYSLFSIPQINNLVTLGR